MTSLTELESSEFEGLAESLTELSITSSDFFTTDVDKSGVLHLTIVKEGQKVEETVFSVLKKNILYTFNTKEDSVKGLEPIDSLNIDGCKGKDGSQPNLVELEEVPGLSLNLNVSNRVSSFTSKKWVFRAENEAEAKEWVAALNKYLGVTSTLTFTPEQLQAIEALRSKLNLNVDIEDTPDSKGLLRLLNARRWDVAAAADLYAETITWRKQFGVDSISSDSIKHVLKAGMFQIPPGMVDKKGRPALILRVGSFDPATMRLLDVIRTYIYMLEGALAARPPGTEQVVTVMDFSGLSRSKFEPRLSRYVINYIQNYYTGLIGSVMIVNQPLFFRVAWNVVSQWIEPDLRRVICVVGDAKKNLRSYFDPDNCTVEYGGVVEYNHDSWVDQHLTASANMGTSLINANVQLAFSDVPASEVKNSTKTGFLTKQGGIIKNWKKRYCVLVEKVLFYYAGKTSDKPQGFVDLTKSSVDPKGSASKKHSFTVNTTTRVWIFVAESENDKKAWIDALNEAINKA